MNLLSALVMISALEAAGGAPPVTPVPNSTGVETALATFRGATGAANAGDRERYLDAVGPWTCDSDPRFLDPPLRATQQRHSFGSIRTHRYQTVVTRDDRDEVVFVESGVWHRQRPTRTPDTATDHGSYEHLVVMRRRDSAWSIAARTPLLGQRCLQFSPPPTADATFNRCVSEHHTSRARCERRCQDKPSTCQACLDEAWCLLTACLRLDPAATGCEGDAGPPDGRPTRRR